MIKNLPNGISLDISREEVFEIIEDSPSIYRLFKKMDYESAIEELVDKKGIVFEDIYEEQEFADYLSAIANKLYYEMDTTEEYRQLSIASDEIYL